MAKRTPPTTSATPITDYVISRKLRQTCVWAADYYEMAGNMAQAGLAREYLQIAETQCWPR